MPNVVAPSLPSALCASQLPTTYGASSCKMTAIYVGHPRLGAPSSHRRFVTFDYKRLPQAFGYKLMAGPCSQKFNPAFEIKANLRLPVALVNTMEAME